MKRLLSFLLVSSTLISISSFRNANLGKMPSDEKATIQVIFNRQLDFNDIVKVKLDLSEKSIVINFNKLEFDKSGKLKSIDFSVDCKDGFSGSGSESNLTNQSRFGFYRNYSKDATSPFGTGNLELPIADD